MNEIVMKKAFVTMLLILLLSPATGWSAGACDSAGKELDNITEQISQAAAQCEMTEPNPCGSRQNCEDTRVPPCGKEQYIEVSQRINGLVEKGNKIWQNCFGGADDLLKDPLSSAAGRGK